MSELAVVDNTEMLAADKEQLVTMMIDGQMFGVPILQVQDIVEPHLITPVPLAPSAIAGVMNLRGRIVTVINLRKCLGLEDRPDGERSMGITVEYHNDLYTLLVDTIGDVRDLARRDFEKPPATLNEKLRQLSTGVFRLKNDLLVVLDVERVLDAEILIKTPPVKLKQRAPKGEGNTKKKKPLATKRRTAAASEPEESDAGDTGAADPKCDAGARKENAKADSNVVSFPTESEPAAASEPQSLFERIGGDAAVEAAVDIFYNKVLADELLKPFFASVDMDRQSFMQRLFLTGAFGGPQAYTGQSLRAAHKSMVEEKGLGEAHFAAVAGHLKSTLEELGVAADLIGEVMTIVGSTREDVLNL